MESIQPQVKMRQGSTRIIGECSNAQKKNYLKSEKKIYWRLNMGLKAGF